MAQFDSNIEDKTSSQKQQDQVDSASNGVASSDVANVVSSDAVNNNPVNNAAKSEKT
ncbi:hypothetical protein ACOBR4_02870 [Gardnerella piotii]|uniref:hypothetical protein n=1 Tax=Gardnerella piotii TaxID=2792977 RepID=UPI003D0390B4